MSKKDASYFSLLYQDSIPDVSSLKPSPFAKAVWLRYYCVCVSVHKAVSDVLMGAPNSFLGPTISQFDWPNSKNIIIKSI